MTGEMRAITQDGHDSNGDYWPIHAAIAKALGGTLQPFDVYQGPYISIGADVRVGTPPYAMPVQGLGCIRLWLYEDEEGYSLIYREDTDQRIMYWPGDTDDAIFAAKVLLNGGLPPVHT